MQKYILNGFSWWNLHNFWNRIINIEAYYFPNLKLKLCSRTSVWVDMSIQALFPWPWCLQGDWEDAHVQERFTLLPWKLATSHCHKYILIILTSENHLSAWQCQRTVMLCWEFFACHLWAWGLCQEYYFCQGEGRASNSLWARCSLGAWGAPCPGRAWQPGPVPLPQPEARLPGAMKGSHNPGHQAHPWDRGRLRLGQDTGSWVHLALAHGWAGQGREELETNIP